MAHAAKEDMDGQTETDPSGLKGWKPEKNAAIPAEPPSPVIIGSAALAFRKPQCENTSALNDVMFL